MHNVNPLALTVALALPALMLALLIAMRHCERIALRIQLRRRLLSYNTTPQRRARFTITRL